MLEWGIYTGIESHVHVYGIGKYYDVPELSALAFQNFEAHDKQILSLAGFLRVAQVAYMCTTSENDPMCQSILRIFLADHRQWVVADEFREAAEWEPSIHKFFVDVMMALYEENLQPEGLKAQKAQSGSQATANRQRLTDLEQTYQALAKSNAALATVEAQVEALNTEKISLQKALEEYESDAQKAEEEIAKLKAEAEEAKAYSAKCLSRIKACQAEKVDVEMSLGMQIARANNEKYRADHSISRQEEQMAVDKHKDHLLRGEAARAERANAILSAIGSMVKESQRDGKSHVAQLTTN